MSYELIKRSHIVLAVKRLKLNHSYTQKKKKIYIYIYI